jgi:hypothetical protein
VAPLEKLADLLAAQGRLEESASAYDLAIALSEAELGIDNSALLPIYEAQRAIDRKRLATTPAAPARRGKLDVGLIGPTKETVAFARRLNRATGPDLAKRRQKLVADGKLAEAGADSDGGASQIQDR